jgi:redox-sensitive bicupin YhaK (pirin superfamily)
MAVREIERISTSAATTEGAGVRLRRAFGFGRTEEYDPFLLLDDFRNDDPAAYAAGFPWHPHRGIETITYMLAGSVEHGDSLGNSGVISAGDVQWMTAGSGIIHQEMPRGDDQGRMHGFQLWANLPAQKKMIPPRYQEFAASEIPLAHSPEGAEARIICGSLWGVQGPVEGIGVDPSYFDLSLPPGIQTVIPVPAGRHAFAYVAGGDGFFGGEKAPETAAQNHNLLLFKDGDEIHVKAGGAGIRFLLVSGLPLKEPVAWYGPIVMNTQEELDTAIAELRNDTFLK